MLLCPLMKGSLHKGSAHSFPASASGAYLKQVAPGRGGGIRGRPGYLLCFGRSRGDSAVQ